MSIANADTKDLIPLNQALRHCIPGNPATSTGWRWATKGLAPAIKGEPRIKLEILYVGSRPHTTKQAIQVFLERATAARLARIERTQRRCADVSEADLATVGLL